MSCLISFDEFCQAVQWGGYTPRVPHPQMYHGLIQGLHRNLGRIGSRLELAMFLSNILHETDGFLLMQGQDYQMSCDNPSSGYYGGPQCHNQMPEPWMDWNPPLFFWGNYVHNVAVGGDFEHVLEIITSITVSDGSKQYRQRRRDLYAHVRIVLGI